MLACGQCVCAPARRRLRRPSSQSWPFKCDPLPFKHDPALLKCNPMPLQYMTLRNFNTTVPFQNALRNFNMILRHFKMRSPVLSLKRLHAVANVPLYPAMRHALLADARHRGALSTHAFAIDAHSSLPHRARTRRGRPIGGGRPGPKARPGAPGRRVRAANTWHSVRAHTLECDARPSAVRRASAGLSTLHSRWAARVRSRGSSLLSKWPAESGAKGAP